MPSARKLDSTPKSSMYRRAVIPSKFCLILSLSALSLVVLSFFQQQVRPLPRLFNLDFDDMRVPRLNVLNADVKSLQNLLESGSINSLTLINAYLAQIQRQDGYLHAMLSMPTKEMIEKLATALDEERAAGKLRSPLHGIPDNINTHPNLGMKSTSGSLALENARPRENARLVDKLLAAGMIVLGKANLSELSNFRGELLTSGWSALGGQVQSPYVRGGVVPGDSKDGHSNPSGSSAGSAVVVAAGYTPLAVGTETDGSLVCPANRAAVYTIKPTIGMISQAGLIPVSHTMDSAGPMAKTPYDIAAFLDILREEDTPGYPAGGYTAVLPCSMDKISVATVDYAEWIFSAQYMKPDKSATEQMNREFQHAYDVIKLVARKYSDKVPLIKPETFNLYGKSSKEMVTLTDFRHDFQTYLENLEVAPVKSLQGLIDFNREHADIELPPDHPNQAVLEAAVALNISEEQYADHLQNLRNLSRSKGIDYILDTYDADVIIGPADSTLSTLASAAGYPVASLPLGYLELNGRAFGIVALARQHQETTLIKFMSAWDSTFNPRKPPPMLVDSSSEFDAN